MFRRRGAAWSEEAFLKASNTNAGDRFASVRLSRNGETLAVGAVQEDSAATGIDGDQISNDAVDSGAVYVFRYAAGAWAQDAYIKASNASAGDGFGLGVLSADGNWLAVCAREKTAAR